MYFTPGQRSNNGVTFAVTVFAESDDGERTDLGTVIVDATDKEEAKREALDAVWDPRFDAASCVPVFVIRQ